MIGISHAEPNNNRQIKSRFRRFRRTERRRAIRQDIDSAARRPLKRLSVSRMIRVIYRSAWATLSLGNLSLSLAKLFIFQQTTLSIPGDQSIRACGIDTRRAQLSRVLFMVEPSELFIELLESKRAKCCDWRIVQIVLPSSVQFEYSCLHFARLARAPEQEIRSPALLGSHSQR